MGLTFDIRGNLKPYEKTKIEFGEFTEFFVDNFENSNTRQEIYSNYSEYLSDFHKEITPNFIQWINGSFVTNKKNPRDIDFVSFIDFDIYEKNEQIIESKFRKNGAKNYYKGIDAYTIKYYPLNHPKRKITEFDMVYWKNWFSETKKNRTKKKFPKGFVELKFGI